MGGVVVPFLTDLETFSVFLVAMPLLILAEAFVHWWTREGVWQ
jgi:hypothetical protein